MIIFYQEMIEKSAVADHHQKHLKKSFKIKHYRSLSSFLLLISNENNRNRPWTWCYLFC